MNCAQDIKSEMRVVPKKQKLVGSTTAGGPNIGEGSVCTRFWKLETLENAKVFFIHNNTEAVKIMPDYCINCGRILC